MGRWVPTTGTLQAWGCLILFWTLGCGSANRDQLIEPDGDGTINEPPTQMSAERLGRDFADSRAAANARYRGRILDLDGLVDRVRWNALGKVSVILQGYSEPHGSMPVSKEINCQVLSRQEAQAIDLSRGQRVRLRGRCEGDSSDFFINLVNVELLDIGADPAVRTTAEELTRAYASDRSKADEVYLGRPLIVEGDFLELLKGDEEPVALLAGFEEQLPRPLRIAATSTPNRKEGLAGLKKGERVTIKGECRGLRDGRVSLSFAIPVRK